MPGINSRDATPLSLTPLAIIAILVLVLHIARGDMLDRLHAHASIAVPDEEAKCPVGATLPAPSLPFD
jgi:hypothetical protein